MKNLTGFAFALGMLAAPALSFAQSDTAPITRAQVRAELIQLEQAGYDVAGGGDANYPAEIQAAQAKIARGSGAQQATRAVGGVVSGGSSESDAPVRMPRVGASNCVGPASYCALYFGN